MILYAKIMVTLKGNIVVTYLCICVKQYCLSKYAMCNSVLFLIQLLNIMHKISISIIFYFHYIRIHLHFPRSDLKLLHLSENFFNEMTDFDVKQHRNNFLKEKWNESSYISNIFYTILKIFNQNIILKV